MDEVADLIERVVRERFSGVTIQSVTVMKDADDDDDAVFLVTVVFDQKGPLDPQKTAGLARHVRHKLLERKENAFPIISFVSKSDAARVGAAAA